MRKIWYCLIAACSMMSLGYGKNADQKAMIHDLTVAKQVFANKYAPKEWKKEYFGWSLQDSFDAAKKKIEDGKVNSIKEYQNIFKEFILSTKDYHVSVGFHKTAKNWYPLIVTDVDGRYFVSNDSPDVPFDFFFYKSNIFDDVPQADEGETAAPIIAKGDEIVAIDGQPVRSFVENLIDKYRNGDRTPTGYAIGAKMLFNNAEEVPETFTLTVQHQGMDTPVVHALRWYQIRELIGEQLLRQEKNTPDLPEAGLTLDQIKQRHPQKIADMACKILCKDYCVGFVKPLLLTSEDEQPQEEEGQEPVFDLRRKGDLPPLGEVLWETEKKNYLYAYLYKNEEGRKIGYIYLPHFMLGDFWIEELEPVINYFEKESDALVFDIRNNPGGNMLFSMAVLSTLTDKPLVCPKQKETLIQEDLIGYTALDHLLPLILKYKEQPVEGEEEKEPRLPNLAGLVLTEELVAEVQAYVQAIRETWASGKRMTTTPLPIIGISHVQPHPKAQYTKPLMLLINELDFSCGDIFPAILQDNKRAVLFGKKTAGAGGYVRGYQHTSRFGVAYYSVTGSILYRTNGQVIENLGVTPDISYDLTVRDVQENFADYIERVNSEVNKLI